MIKGSTVFLRNQLLHKLENGFTMNTEISHHLVDHAMKQLTRQFHKKCFHHSKCLACNSEKTLQLKITKKEWIDNFINIYTNILYIPILYVTRMTQNKKWINKLNTAE